MSSKDSNRLTQVPSSAELSRLDCAAESPNPPTRTKEVSFAGIDEPGGNYQPKKTQKRPPRIPLNVNVEPGASKLKALTFFLTAEDPWSLYLPVREENQAGMGILAYKNVRPFPVAFIKERPPSCLRKDLHSLKEISHPNIVQLKEAFSTAKAVFFVYETMKISLAQLQGSPYVSFNEADIAAVCMEVLQGLRFIHDEINTSCGPLDSHDVLLSEEGEGSIKIANVGECLVKPKTLYAQRLDVRSVGHIALKLKERHTGLEHPDSMDLQEPENASSELVDFIQQSSVASIDRLLQHDLLLKSPGPWALKPYIIKALPFIVRHYRDIQVDAL